MHYATNTAFKNLIYVLHETNNGHVSDTIEELEKEPIHLVDDPMRFSEIEASKEHSNKNPNVQDIQR
ncbi:hypothetical protein GWI33_008643 [Rhynchophorus ferrugineus]|uniref:Uncharacterized protein n=1 Tax=Rhynchophorus ferrugineus TaxID=354439 RepID=A0A834MC48_RHYFE|nr:hypothetical protein GWI33_008643 [Rhynchophorus ferrugineus]